MHKTDALDQWCLQKLLGIKWYHHVQNDVRQTTGQPNLSVIVQALFFSVRPHCANARRNRCQDLNSLHLENWRRLPGGPRTTWMNMIQHELKSNNLSLNEATDVAQNHPLWRVMSTFGTTHSKCCLPEMNKWNGIGSGFSKHEILNRKVLKPVKMQINKICRVCLLQWCVYTNSSNNKNNRFIA